MRFFALTDHLMATGAIWPWFLAFVGLLVPQMAHASTTFTMGDIFARQARREASLFRCGMFHMGIWALVAAIYLS